MGIAAEKDECVGRGGADLVGIGGGGVELEGVLYLVVDERGLEEQHFEIREVVVIVPKDQLSPRTL